jgi:hypothetical protein
LQESKTLGSDIPRTKSQDAKFLEFFWLLTSRLCVFAGDIPILVAALPRWALRGEKGIFDGA